MTSSTSSRAPDWKTSWTPGELSSRSFRSRDSRASSRSGALPGKHDADDRLIGDALLLDDRLLGVRREPAAGEVDLGARVGQRLLGGDGGFELQGDDRHVLAGHGVHVLHALDRLELDLQRLDQQALGVLGAHAGERHGDEDVGQLDVRLRLSRHAEVGEQAEQAGDEGHAKHDLAALDGPIDQRFDHPAPPVAADAQRAMATRTFWPSAT
nr:hypothetical protein [Phenylobacterium sp. J367]